MDNSTPVYVRRYLLNGLAATPGAMTALLAGVTDAEWDARPDSERFTLREALAHIADWEGVWLQRMRRIVTEDSPTLPGYDEGQWAIDHDYAHTNPAEQLSLLRKGRKQMVEYLTSLDGSAWARVGIRPEIGAITLFEMVSMILGHDGYHIQQILDYRGLGQGDAE